MSGQNLTKTIAKAISLLSGAFLVYTQIIWITISSQKGLGSQMEKVSAFLRYFPEFMRSTPVITLGTLLFALLGIISSIIWNNRVSGSQKLLPIVVLIVSILVLLLTIFQLM